MGEKVRRGEREWRSKKEGRKDGRNLGGKEVIIIIMILFL